MSIYYSLRIVGGPFDGVPGMAWVDDGRHPLPDGLLVGVCPVGVHCGTSLCRPREEHVSYWLPDEEGQPPRLTYYEKQPDEHVRRGDAGELRGVATYAIGGLLDPQSGACTVGVRPVVPEMVPLGKVRVDERQTRR